MRIDTGFRRRVSDILVHSIGSLLVKRASSQTADCVHAALRWPLLEAVWNRFFRLVGVPASRDCALRWAVRGDISYCVSGISYCVFGGKKGSWGKGAGNQSRESQRIHSTSPPKQRRASSGQVGGVFQQACCPELYRGRRKMYRTPLIIPKRN